MNNPMPATERSAQYVQEWLRERETELWAGQALLKRGKPVITVVHCAGFDGEPPGIEVRIGKLVRQSIPATRNWQNERRAAVKAGMLLAGQNGYRLAIDAAMLITRMDWYRAAVPLLAELARHVTDGRDGRAFISLPTATESDLCRDLRRLADAAILPFDPEKSVYTVIGANNMDVAADIATGFHMLCLDAGAAMVRPACSDGFYDEGHGCWRISMQLKDGVTLDQWVRALAALWREAFDDIAMGVEVGDGAQRLLRADLQDVPATA